HDLDLRAPQDVDDGDGLDFLATVREGNQHAFRHDCLLWVLECRAAQGAGTAGCGCSSSSLTGTSRTPYSASSAGSAVSRKASVSAYGWPMPMAWPLRFARSTRRRNWKAMASGSAT